MKITAKWIIFASVALVFSPALVHAETMYVTDTLKLTLRSGPGLEYKILAVVESGQSLQILQPGNEWVQVRLENGKEGWVLNRYLTAEPTHGVKLARLEEQHKTLQQQAAALLEENTRYKAENKKIRAALATASKNLTRLQKDYETLKSESSGFLKLKSRYEKAAAQLAKQTQKANRLEAAVSKLELNQYIKWFLAGSGVLLLGFIIGFSARRQRRRSSLL